MNISIEAIGTEPVTAAELKTYIGLDASAHDTLIGEIITAAREWYEDHTQRLVEQRAVTLELDARETRSPIRLPYGALVTVTSIKTWDESADDWSSAIASTNYRVIRLDPGMIEMDNDGWNVEVNRKALQIVYECGSSVTKVAKEAIMDYASRLYDGRGSEKDTAAMEYKIIAREGINPVGVVWT